MLGLNGSRRRFIDLAEVAAEHNAVLEIGSDATIRYANEKFCSVFGCTAQSVIGKPVWSLAQSGIEDGRSPEAFFADLIKNRFAVCEFRTEAADGRKIYATARFYIPKGASKAKTIYALISDTTQIQAARAILEAKVRAYSSALATIEFDLEGNIKTANANFLSVMGYELNEICGQHHRIFVDPVEVASPAYGAFWDSLRSGTTHTTEFRRLGKGGKTVWIQGSYCPLSDASGKVTGVMKFATDITKQKSDQLRRDEARQAVESGMRGVKTSVESTSQQATSAAAAAMQASANVNAVAAGSSQLSSSVQEINSQVSKALDVSNEAVQQAQQAGETVSSLVEDAKKISAVVDLISSIASQTNLLALNATIEAARAGEAGRGFAVVAGEVKNLAAQTAKATGEISAHIQAVQGSSEHARRAIEAISGTIASINGISVSISAAVEEQSAVTSDMAQNMQEAARGVEMITQSMEEVAQLTREADAGIAHVLEASRQAS
ncbi:PAS domain [Rhabdaerophilaceae bacterium]